MYCSDLKSAEPPHGDLPRSPRDWPHSTPLGRARPEASRPRGGGGTGRFLEQLMLDLKTQARRPPRTAPYISVQRADSTPLQRSPVPRRAHPLPVAAAQGRRWRRPQPASWHPGPPALWCPGRPASRALFRRRAQTLTVHTSALRSDGLRANLPACELGLQKEAAGPAAGR